MAISQAVAPANAKNRPYVLRKGVSVLSDLADGNAVYGYPGDYYGRIYYVNNIDGDSSYDGLSWDTPFDEVSTAITAAETYRALPSGTTNDYQRNIIFVQGTGTPYSAITSLPSYCDIVGIGADCFGNGAGIARIGADSGTSDGVDATATARGVNFYNIQFQAGNAGYAFRGTNLFRSGFYHCCFATNGSPGGAPAAGVDLDIAGGVVWKDCLWLNQSSTANQFTVGMTITSTHFHGCWVENCLIGGDTGVQIGSTVVNGWSSWFKDCYIGQLSETCAIGVDDNATTGHILYCGCFVQATDAFDLANNSNRIIGCTSTNAFAT